MNHLALIVLGIFISISTSWFGFYLTPSAQYRNSDVVETEAGFHPVKDDPMVARGREVYREYGCVYCHTQQIRPSGFSSDLERSWGGKRSVAQDYLGKNPPLIGNLRVGSDLSDIGSRHDSEWLTIHLYNPRIHQPESNMPGYSFLYEETNHLGGIPDGTKDLDIPSEFKPGPNYTIIPKAELNALVAYLTSLKVADSPSENK